MNNLHVQLVILAILFTGVTAGSCIAAKPNPNSTTKEKFARCTDAKGATFHPVRDTGNGEGEKCCYPRNKRTGLKTCIKCTYPGGDSNKAICTKNQFKSVMDTPNLDSQNLPTTNAPPKPLTRTERLKRGHLNPGSTPGEMEMPEAPTSTPAQRTRDRYYMGR